MLSTCFHYILYRFSVFFEPVPTSRILLGVEYEALLRLAGQSVNFQWFLFPFRLHFAALGLPFGHLF